MKVQKKINERGPLTSRDPDGDLLKALLFLQFISTLKSDSKKGVLGSSICCVPGTCSSPTLALQRAGLFPAPGSPVPRHRPPRGEEMSSALTESICAAVAEHLPLPGRSRRRGEERREERRGERLCPASPSRLSRPAPGHPSRAAFSMQPLICRSSTDLQPPVRGKKKRDGFWGFTPCPCMSQGGRKSRGKGVGDVPRCCVVSIAAGCSDRRVLLLLAPLSGEGSLPSQDLFLCSPQQVAWSGAEPVLQPLDSPRVSSLGQETSRVQHPATRCS